MRDEYGNDDNYEGDPLSHGRDIFEDEGDQLANIDGSQQTSGEFGFDDGFVWGVGTPEEARADREARTNVSGNLSLEEDSDSAADAFFAQAEAAIASGSSPMPTTSGTPRRDAQRARKKMSRTGSGKGAVGRALVDAIGTLNITGVPEGESSPDNDMAKGVGASVETLQLGRISHVPDTVQYAIKTLLGTGQLEGAHPVDVAAALEEFGSITGVSNEAFAKQIKAEKPSDVTVNGRVRQYQSSQEDIATAISMLSNTAGEYLERGPGGQMIGNISDGEKQYKADTDLNTAIGYVQEIAGHYLDDRTIGSPVEAARRLAVEEAITKRLIDGTFYEGSKNILGLPNELTVSGGLKEDGSVANLTGLKTTQGIYGSFQGTAEDRLSSSQFDDLYKQLPTAAGQKTKFVRDDSGYKVFRDDVTEAQRKDVLRRTPSLANSLFPKPKAIGKQVFTSEEKAKHKRDQDFAMATAQRKATFARKIFRQELITNRDESKGNTQRMAGWDTPYGEQADVSSLRNEAAILGEEWNSFYADQKDDDSKQSSMNDLVQKLAEKETISRYVEPSTFDQSFQYRQGTKGWLRQREGKITASTAANLLTEKGMDSAVYTMARKNLNIEDTEDDFIGNAHTREGNDGEGRAQAAFMASKHAKGLNFNEAFFEENKDLPGFGVSPDGRLTTDEGESAGLLELKYLSSGSMEGALKKYTPQLQMQMAVTGESQTHFYALDKFTGEYVHELVQADPTMQAELVSRGFEVQEEARKLNAKGVKTLRDKIKSKKFTPRKQVGAVEEVRGQQESIVLEEDIDQPMTAFQASVLATAKTPASGGIASQTLLAKKMYRQEQADKMKQAVDNAKDLPTEELVFEEANNLRKGEQAKARSAFVDGNIRPAFGDSADLVSTEMANYYKAEEKAASAATKEEAQVRRMAAAETAAYAEESKRNAPAIEASKVADAESNVRGQAGARNRFNENNQRAAFGDTDNGVNKDMADFYQKQEDEANEAAKAEEAASKESIEAAKEASSSLREFGNEVKKASKVLGELANVVMSGNKSGMDEVRLAAESGLDVGQVRGMRKAMEVAGMSEGGINKVVSTAGNLVTTFNDERTSASKFTELMSTRGASNLESINQLEMPSYQEFQNMDAQQMTVMVAGMMQGKSKEARTQIGNMFGMSELAVSNISPEMISGLDSSISEEGLKSTNKGIQLVEQEKRRLLETVGSLGEESGKATAVVGIGSAVVGSATAGYVASKFAKGTKASKILEAAKASKTGVMGSITSGASTALKTGGKVLGGIGAAYAIGDWALDQANEIDAAFFDGELNETNRARHDAEEAMLTGDWKAGTWWADDSPIDDAVPSNSIGKMPMKGREESKTSSNIVNVEVTNEISSDMIRTTTDVDGDLNVDEESNIGTGG